MYHCCYYVYTNVTARNAAGLIAIATSDPVLIDLTAPIIQFVLAGGRVHGIDIITIFHQTHQRL